MHACMYAKHNIIMLYLCMNVYRLNPSIYLKRPKDKKDWDEWRLDKLLIKKAVRPCMATCLLIFVSKQKR